MTLDEFLKRCTLSKRSTSEDTLHVQTARLLADIGALARFSFRLNDVTIMVSRNPAELVALEIVATEFLRGDPEGEYDKLFVVLDLDPPKVSKRVYGESMVVSKRKRRSYGDGYAPAEAHSTRSSITCDDPQVVEFWLRRQPLTW
mgnify:CR=1 FL=1